MFNEVNILRVQPREQKTKKARPNDRDFLFLKILAVRLAAPEIRYNRSTGTII